MSGKKQRVAIIVPAYNEATTIADVISGTKKAFHNSPYRCEIIVVDDGSNDGTGAIAKKQGAHLIEHVLNTGSGGATATGLSYAQQAGFDIAATLDADGQHNPDDLFRGVNQLANSTVDLLIGSRLINSTGMSRTKIIGNKGLSIITFLMFGVNVTDSQSGLRVFSKRALENLKWRTNGYEFCSEMLWRAKQQGLQISEFPIQAIYTEYSVSKGQNNWNAFRIVSSLLKRRLMETFGE